MCPETPSISNPDRYQYSVGVYAFNQLFFESQVSFSNAVNWLVSAGAA
jgi:hypothetical protein